MRKPLAERCAYCSEPLRLVAGFCEHCHASAALAQRVRLIAAPRRWAGSVPAGTGVTLLADAPPVASRPLPRWARITLLIGLISLVLAVFFITLRLNGDSLPLPFLPASSDLAASATNDGPPTTNFAVGQPLYLRYAVAVTHADATIQLRVTPAHAQAYLLTERWPRGDIRRVLPFVALTPGRWQIVLLANGQVIQSLAVVITPGA